MLPSTGTYSSYKPEAGSNQSILGDSLGEPAQASAAALSPERVEQALWRPEPREAPVPTLVGIDRPLLAATRPCSDQQEDVPLEPEEDVSLASRLEDLYRSAGSEEEFADLDRDQIDQILRKRSINLSPDESEQLWLAATRPRSDQQEDVLLEPEEDVSLESRLEDLYMSAVSEEEFAGLDRDQIDQILRKRSINLSPDESEQLWLAATRSCSDQRVSMSKLDIDSPSPKAE